LLAEPLSGTFLQSIRLLAEPLNDTSQSIADVVRRTAER